MFDMKQCKPGDKLISKRGLVFTYVGPNKSCDIYPHFVKSPSDRFVSRTDEGFVCVDKHLSIDHDIVGFAPEGS